MLDNNREALKNVYPDLLNYLEGISSNHFEIKETRTGQLTASLNGRWLHSKYNPEREAVKTVEEEGKRDLYIIGGLGLGYIPEALIKRQNTTPIVIFEPSVELFYETLLYRDISSLIYSSSVYLLLGQTAESIKDYFKPEKIRSIGYFPLNNRVLEDSKVFNALENNIKLYLSRLTINRNTLLKFGELWVKNQCKNLPLMTYQGDISQIFNKFSGIPGLIVAAGPSLELIIPHLKELKERCLLLCVDTALKSLLDEGIEPDIVMSIDAQYWNARHLEGIECNKTILIADSAIQPAALRSFKERVFFTHSTFPLGLYFEKERAPFPRIASGGSVSTNIWDFAQKLGCRDLYFIGQDLGYPGNITHYKNSYFEKRMLNTSTRLNPLETSSFRYIYDGYPVIAESNLGYNILSDSRMKVYREWFKEMTPNATTTTYNLSPNGCRISGMDFREVDELLQSEIVRERVESILSTLNTSERNYYNSNILSAAIEFKNDLENLKSYSEEALNLTDLIERKYNRKDDFQQELYTLTKIDNKIVGFSSSVTLSFIIQHFIEQISRSEGLSPIDALKISRELYNKICKTCDLHTKHLNYSIIELQKHTTLL